MRVSVILLEFHSVSEIAAAVQSVRRFDDNCEIIVSSNSLYTPDEQQRVCREVPGVRWVFNEKNGGFGYGMTMGAWQARGEYLVSLNSDVLLRSDFQEMVDYLERHKQVGMIAPQLEAPNGEVQDSYRDFITPLNLVRRNVKRFFHRLPDPKLSAPQTVDWVIGAFMLTKKAYFERVGGFDYQRYFMYVEDMDLCRELKREGLQTVYYPLAKAEYVGTRASRKKWKYTKIHLQSLCRYWQKNLFRRPRRN